MSSGTDKVFDKVTDPNDFTFNKEVVSVFDDMVSRSVPFYDEMQRMTAELAQDFAQDETNVYDIGCSTGTTLHLLISGATHKAEQRMATDTSYWEEIGLFLPQLRFVPLCLDKLPHFLPQQKLRLN